MDFNQYVAEQLRWPELDYLHRDNNPYLDYRKNYEDDDENEEEEN